MSKKGSRDTRREQFKAINVNKEKVKELIKMYLHITLEKIIIKNILTTESELETKRANTTPTSAQMNQTTCWQKNEMKST